jgi:hypothetical protein
MALDARPHGGCPAPKPGSGTRSPTVGHATTGAGENTVRERENALAGDMRLVAFDPAATKSSP